MRLLHIFISPEHNYFGHHGLPPGDAPTVEVAEAELVAGQGIVGDRFFGFKENYKGQVTFFEKEIHDAVCDGLGLISTDRPSPGVYRRNLIVSGQDLNALIGQEFEVQGVRFAGIAECSPCHWMDQAVQPGTEAALKNHGGLRARILTSGTLRRE